MKQPNPSRRTPMQRIARVLFPLITAMLTVQPLAYAAPNPSLLAQAPLFVDNIVPANASFILDDSLSMASGDGRVIDLTHAGISQTGGAFDRFGRLAWRSGAAPVVDHAAPVVYYRVAYTRYHGHTLTQLDGLELVFVGPIRALGVRARIGVVIEHARHAALGHDAQVFDAGDFGKVGGHVCWLSGTRMPRDCRAW